MAREITLRELRSNGEAILRELDRGETFIVTRNGQPVGELTPLRVGRSVDVGAMLALLKGAPRIDYQRFVRDLDSVASQTIDPRV